MAIWFTIMTKGDQMLSENNRSRKQAREVRLPLVAELYKKGFSLRKIRDEINSRFALNVSIPTIHKDIKLLLSEWRASRIESIDDLVTLELARIDDCLVELWEQWEKSKENYTRVVNSRVGVPVGENEAESGEALIVTVRRQQNETSVVVCGNPAYMSEIRQQLIERRKLLGLYAPEKRDFSGSVVKVENMTNEQIEEELKKIREARNV